MNDNDQTYENSQQEIEQRDLEYQEVAKRIVQSLVDSGLGSFPNTTPQVSAGASPIKSRLSLSVAEEMESDHDLTDDELPASRQYDYLTPAHTPRAGELDGLKEGVYTQQQLYSLINNYIHSKGWCES